MPLVDPSSLRLSVRAGLFALVYLGGAELGHALSFPGQVIATFWPPSGLLLAVLLRSNPRRWWVYLVAALAAHIVSDVLWRHQPVAVSLCIWAVNSLEAVAGAWLLRRLLHPQLLWADWKAVLTLAAVTTLVSTPLSATVGAAALAWTGMDPAVGPLWQVWWAGHLLGVLVVGPVFLSWDAGPWWKTIRPPRVVEAGVVLVLVGAAAFVIFGRAPDSGSPLLKFPYYITFPFGLWAAFRFGVRGAAWAVFVLAMPTLWNTTRGFGPFVGAAATITERALLLQTFLGISSLTFLTLAAERAAREQAHEALLRRTAELAHVARLGVLGEMASGLAHELNQPLTAILNFSQGCLRRIHNNSGTAADLLPGLAQVVAQAERAGEIIRRMRDLASRRETRSVPLALNGVVREVIDLAGTEIRHGEIKLRLLLAEPLTPVCADKVLIEQVLLNLILNALEAMSGVAPDERELTVQTAGRAEGGVEVVVRDTGPGLSPEARQHLFESFYTSKEQGMGVGLSISRSIIEAHGGRLEALPGAGRGATFRFTLPTQPGEEVHEANRFRGR